MYYSEKKNKQVEEQILAKKKKNENEICPCTAAKKDTTGYNKYYTKSEKSQNQTTENGEKRDNKKSGRKRDIQKQIKLKERERQCKRRKNIHKICLSKKGSKSLIKNESAPGKRKSENEICTIVKTNKQVEEQILAKKKKMKMKYVHVQQQRKILEDAIIAILRVKNPRTKLQKMVKKETIKSLQGNEIFKNKLS